jgi:hypothetical protein
MNKIKLIAIIEILFGIIIISSYIILNKVRNNISAADTQSQINLSSCEEDKRTLFSQWKYELNSNETKLSKNIFLEDENFNKINIGKVFNGRPKLVFRITDNVASCYDCKSKVLIRLKALSELIGLDNIIIFGRYAKMRDLIITKESENINYNIYNFNENLNIYADRNDKIDYLFIVDENLETKLTFIATNVTKEKIEAYFNKISNWFDSNN